jgi:pimeloyl-ACP methyl ester carboxylesterase
MMVPRLVQTDTLEFGILEQGTGPLALCLHGFPDSAHSWRHLLPALADAGFHAVAPFMRGYAPSAIPDDGCYRSGALVADVVALHEALGGDERSVLIGHDWGAEAAFGAAAFAPERFLRLVGIAVPPAAIGDRMFQDYGQLKRFWYFLLFLTPFAEELVDLALIERLWRDWSPRYDPGEDLELLEPCLRDPARLAAAIGYYRAYADTAEGRPYEAETAARLKQAPQPTLYLHGAEDRCIGLDVVRGTERYLAPGSRMDVIDDAGHFLHLEQPEVVNERIVAWVSGKLSSQATSG